MNMIVCVKQVIDSEAPPGVPLVISPFDENAVEGALKIKDAHGGRITAISLGNNLQRDVVKKPLSMEASDWVKNALTFSLVGIDKNSLYEVVK